jgi:hypothetical protein
MRYATSALAGALMAGGLTVAGLAPASAADVTLDFGNIGADGGSVCSSGCVIPGAFEHTFSVGAVTVGAIGYMAGGAVGYVTQKPGSFEGPGETGIGESDTYPAPSDSDWEITPETALVLDNLTYNNIGYKSVSLTIESMQSGEGAFIYGSRDGIYGDFVLLGSLNGANGVTQVFNTGAWNYLGVMGWNVDGNHPDADVAVAVEVVSLSAPESSTWAMMLLGFAGLGFAGYRKAKGAAAVAA